MLKFIKSAIATSDNLPEDDLPDLLDILYKNMGGYEPARGFGEIHASDITKKDFCPRQVALLDTTGKSPSPVYIDAATRATFDQGDAISDLLRSKWLGSLAFGNWRCRICKTLHLCCTKPVQTGNNFCCSDVNGKYCRCDWHYEEMKFFSEEFKVTGSFDVLVKHGSKLMIVEAKIIAPDQFETLLAPLSEHRQRTALYMRLLEGSKSTWKHLIMMDRAKVLYVSRAHGKKHPVYGKILPFKQFTVERDDTVLEGPAAKALQVRRFREEGIMPLGVCPTMNCPTAKKCSVVVECFSGKYKGIA